MNEKGEIKATQALLLFIQQGKSCLNTREPVPKQHQEIEMLLESTSQAGSTQL